MSMSKFACLIREFNASTLTLQYLVTDARMATVQKLFTTPYYQITTPLLTIYAPAPC